MRHGSDTWPDCAQFDGCERTADGRLLALDRRVQLTMGWCHARTGFSTAKPHPDALACSHVSAYLPNASGVPPPPADAFPAHVHFVGCARRCCKAVWNDGTNSQWPWGAIHRLVGGTLRERFSRCHTRAPVATRGAQRRVSVLLSESLSGRFMGRTARIAQCRGTLLSEVRRAWSNSGHSARAPPLVATTVVLDLDCKRPVDRSRCEGPSP